MEARGESIPAGDEKSADAVPFSYDVRQVAPEQVRDSVIRVWRENLPIGEGAALAFFWMYEQAPTPADALMVLVARRPDGGEQVVGTASYVVRAFRATGRELRAAVLSSVAVDAKHRKALPALRLVKGLRELVTPRYDFTYGFPNEKAIGILNRAGYRTRLRANRYACAIRHAAYIRRRLPGPVWLANLAGSALDVGRRVMTTALAAPRLPRYRLEWPSKPDRRFDDLWVRAADEYDLIGRRDAAFLQWRFCRHPEQLFQIAALVERRSGDIRAYAVVQDDDAVCYIRDLFGHRAEIGPLLDLLLASHAVRGGNSISIHHLGLNEVVRDLEARGFSRRDGHRSVVFESAPAGELGTDDQLRRWHMTDADEDM